MGPWLGFLAPAGTPKDIVDTLNAAITASIAEPQVTEVMKKMTMVIDKMQADEYQKFVNSEYERWGTYIRTAGIANRPEFSRSLYPVCGIVYGYQFPRHRTNLQETVSSH